MIHADKIEIAQKMQRKLRKEKKRQFEEFHRKWSTVKHRFRLKQILRNSSYISNNLHQFINFILNDIQ